MRVFYVNSVCGTGSTGRIVTDLCEVLQNEGHDVFVAYGIGQASRIEADKTICINNKIGYYTHNFVSRLTDRAGFYSSLETEKLITAIKEFQPDLIHLHNLHGYYLNIAILFRFLSSADIPVVWTLHDCWPMTGHCAHFDYANCDKWKNGCNHCPQLSSYPKSCFLDQSARNYEEKKNLFTAVKNMTIITPSEWLAGIVKQSYLSKYPVYTIPNGIDLNIFKPTESDFRERHQIGDKTMVLAVSNVWSEKKGFSDVCKLAQILDHEEYQVVMVGLTKKQIEVIPESIVPITRTNSIEELVEIYSAADVFINTTYQDTFPTVNLEALACGAPVITYETGGSPEAINMLCGRTIKRGDFSEMANVIVQMKHCRKEDAIARAKQFNRTTQYGKYLNLYQAIL